MTETARPIRSYEDSLMRHVASHGVPKADRTGTGTRSVFGHQMRFDLSEGFPLVTTRRST
jgi:thymidylate synthase